MKQWDDLITPDHKVLNEEGDSRNNDRYAVVVQVLATQWNPCQTETSQETNGIAERAVRRVKEGTSAVLLQSSLYEKWWADSMECFCYLRNVQDLLADGKTPCERRFGEPFKGPVFFLGRWLNIIRFLHETSQESTNLVRKFHPGYSLAVH